jgi:hypothetical protein
MDTKLMTFDAYNVTLDIMRKHGTAFYYIKQSKGHLHKSMQGMFTQVLEAEKAIKQYMTQYMKVPNTSRNNKENVEQKIKDQEGKKLDG